MSNFASDNTTGAAPQIVAALAEAMAPETAGPAMPYGNDPWTEKLRARVNELFEWDCAVFPVATGTAANSLALTALTPRYGAIYCHREAHINEDECGAPEFFTGGAKLVPLEGAHAKLDAETLAAAVTGGGDIHHVQPAAVSITQASEKGAVYRPEEVAALSEVARSKGLALHMDGARFANAVARLGCSPAEITWKAGVDALSLGGTKNGCLAAEAVVFFDPARAGELGFYRKRAGHLFSKGRVLSAQLLAYLEDDLWLANAAHANSMAAKLAEGLTALGIELLHPVEANELFPRIPEAGRRALQAKGHVFYHYPAEDAVRLVTAFCSRTEEVESFLADLAAGLGKTGDAGRADLRQAR
ncbi:MAG: low specificity L-threonine aldolase [Rhodovibrionaceae bacterium]